jgi:Ni,Fe-hydrogenase III small subunit
MAMIRVYRMNSGSCGGCDVEIDTVVALNADMEWAADPMEAHVLVLTGPLTSATRPVVLAIWRELGGKVPLVAVGRSAIDGHPYGRGGLAEYPEITAQAKVDGCPADPAAIAAAIRQASGQGKGT